VHCHPHLHSFSVVWNSCLCLTSAKRRSRGREVEGPRLLSLCGRWRRVVGPRTYLDVVFGGEGDVMSLSEIGSPGPITFLTFFMFLTFNGGGGGNAGEHPNAVNFDLLQ
jgi:hypothetical protein